MMAMNRRIGAVAMPSISTPAGSAELAAVQFRPIATHPMLGRTHLLAGDSGSGEWSRLVRSEIQARAARTRFFEASLFSDPAWDILLELFCAEQEGRRVSISAAGLAAEIPLTTALRWINALEREGLAERMGDPTDARRTFLSLTETGLRAMTLYFQNCS
jgi:DNA-binding MarR family transcriptional regulator